jgi:hypothetical protein
MLVEGESIELSIDSFTNRFFCYAETFAVPAAVGSYTLFNKSQKSVKVIVSFVKDEFC